LGIAIVSEPDRNIDHRPQRFELRRVAPDDLIVEIGARLA
jgi:hypothetical protein